MPRDVLSERPSHGVGLQLRLLSSQPPGNRLERVVVRCSYLREQAALRKAGADEVFSGEGEVALAITGSVLGKLGATPEQIDRERDRVRDDLFIGPTMLEAAGAPDEQSGVDSSPAVTPGQQPGKTVEQGDPRLDAGGPELRGTPPAQDV